MYSGAYLVRYALKAADAVPHVALPARALCAFMISMVVMATMGRMKGMQNMMISLCVQRTLCVYTTCCVYVYCAACA